MSESNDTQTRRDIPEVSVPDVTVPEGIGEPPTGTPKGGHGDGLRKAWIGAIAVTGLVVAGNLALSGSRVSSSDPSEPGKVLEQKGRTGSATRSSSSSDDDLFSSKPDTLADELLAVGMRYRPSGEDDHYEQWDVIRTEELSDDPGDDWRFAAGVITAVQALTESETKGTSSVDLAIDLASESAGEDAYRQEFVELLRGLKDGTWRSGVYGSYGREDSIGEQSMGSFLSPDGSGATYDQSASQGASAGRGVTTSNGFKPGDMLGDAAKSGGFSVGSSSQNASRRTSAQSTSSAPSTSLPSYAESETYAHMNEPGFLSPETNPVSIVSADADTASYANFRRQVRSGYDEDSIYDDSVRVEEWLNYFDYDYEAPDGDDLFGLTTHLGECPWNEDSLLLTMGFATDLEAAKPEGGKNIVFLVDVSGSMYSSDKLPLLKEALIGLADRLDDEDRISLVTYASDGRVVLSGVKGSDRDTIKKAVSELWADGATNGGAGLQRAYDAAKANFIEGGANRIILCSDGDMNLGLSTTGELTDLVTGKRDEGIYLSVLGFGTGNYHDQNMEAIADNGNGSYYYIDCLDEANKVLDEEFASTMVPLADDVKVQVEFNPANVKAYRLIGYVNRTLSASDFRDDAKDAGEIGSGQAFTVAYEIVPVGSDADPAGGVELRYGRGGKADAGDEGEGNEAGKASGLDGITCEIGGDEYADFDPGTYAYEVSFGQGEALPGAPIITNLPDGWEASPAKSRSSADGSSSTHTITIANGETAKTYSFKYVSEGTE